MIPMPERLPRLLKEPNRSERSFNQSGYLREAPLVAESRITEEAELLPLDIPSDLSSEQLVEWAAAQGAALTFEDAEYLREHTELLNRPDLRGKTILFLGTRWKRGDTSYYVVLRRNKDRWFYRFDPTSASNMKNCVVLKIEQPTQLD